VKRTAFYLWMIPRDRDGKLIRSTWRMTDEQAQERYKGKAVRIDGPPEWRDLPETPDEVAMNTSARTTQPK
jgi:hypothetical protein